MHKNLTFLDRYALRRSFTKLTKSYKEKNFFNKIMNKILPAMMQTHARAVKTFKPKTNSNTNYSFIKPTAAQNGFTNFVQGQNICNTIIQSYFSNTQKYCFISKPTFSSTAKKITIQLFYYMPSTIQQQLNKDSLSGLSTTLAQLFKKEVNLVFIRVYYPYLNSSILAQYLAHNAPSNTFIDFQEAILTYPSIHRTNLPAYISGIKIQVSGRLVTETVIPRVTVKSTLIGSFKTNIMHQHTTLIDYSKFVTKNELGAFTIKVWICQQSLRLRRENIELTAERLFFYETAKLRSCEAA